MKLFSLIALLLACFLSGFSQGNKASVSGTIRNASNKTLVGYANVLLKNLPDSSFNTGVISNEAGIFVLQNVAVGNYLIEISATGYSTKRIPFLAGKLNIYYDLGTIDLAPANTTLSEVRILASQEAVNAQMDKKSFKVSDNISQSGSSLLQTMRNLPGISIDENGKVLLRGSSRVSILVDGKQNALTGFGNQAALDNIPASAIDRIEIINNPSARYDANGNAGIINIIYKKSKQNGFHGKAGITGGLGALWIKQESLPGTRPQYQATPKFNPSISLNFRKDRLNAFFQGDYLYNATLNRNEFAKRYYPNGDTIIQQVQRNRITKTGTVRAGLDWFMDDKNTLTVSGLYSNEYVTDRGDIPYYNNELSELRRLWQFYEDETNSALTASAVFQHRFSQPGHLLNMSLNYTFHREDEKYFLTDNQPTYTGKDTFMLIADENVTDLNVDYIRPLRHGRLEAGTKFRWRYIPTNMEFFPGINSPLDTNAAGWAKYSEVIPAVYANYVYESGNFELEAGLRLENVDLQYTVDPTHNTYKSDGYTYFEPFPSVRAGYNINEKNKITVYYNRRVDRPDEGDIRIFPKYDEPEILKVGNPALRPQFTQRFEAGYKTGWSSDYFYAAVFHKQSRATITRIGTTVPGDNIIYTIFQNAGNSRSSGLEIISQLTVSPTFSFNINATAYRNVIDSFSGINLYPTPVAFVVGKQEAYSGNIKWNGLFKLPKDLDIQLTATYLAPDIIPQGRIDARFALDIGAKKMIQRNKGEIFLNATDLLNTMRIEKDIQGNTFRVVSTDYYETQVFRVGYSYKF